MFSNIGEHVRRLSPLASGAALHAGLSQERSRGLSPVEGISGSGTSGALTCTGGNGFTRLEKGLLRQPGIQPPREMSEGSIRRSCRQPIKQRRSPSHRASGREVTSIDPKPAARRQARGRWRLDDRKVVRRRPRFGGNATRADGDLEVESWRVFPRRSADGLRR